MTNTININEYPVKCLTLGDGIFRHFEIMIIPTEKKGKIMLKDKNDLIIYQYEFKEEGIKAIKRFLEML